jgi:hypothetical protein
MVSHIPMVSRRVPMVPGIPMVFGIPLVSAHTNVAAFAVVQHKAPDVPSPHLHEGQDAAGVEADSPEALLELLVCRSPVRPLDGRVDRGDYLMAKVNNQVAPKLPRSTRQVQQRPPLLAHLSHGAM